MLFILGHMINACSGPAGYCVSIKDSKLDGVALLVQTLPDATPPLGKIHTSNSYINITFEKIIGF